MGLLYFCLNDLYSLLNIIRVTWPREKILSKHVVSVGEMKNGQIFSWTISSEIVTGEI